jgi:hypothetical protein
VNGQIHTLAVFLRGERTPCAHWIGGWVDFRAGLDAMEKRKVLPLPGI